MRPECENAIRIAAQQLLGRPATDGEVAGIETRLKGSMKELSMQQGDRWLQTPERERYAQATGLAKQRMMEQMTQAHVATLHEARLQAQWWDSLSRVDAGKKLDFLRQNLSSVAGKTVSLEDSIKARRNILISKLADLKNADPGKFWGAVQDPARQDALMHAIYGKTTGDPEVDNAGSTVTRLLERVRQMAEDAGIPIHALDSWHVPRSWSPWKIAADREGFVNEMMARANRSAYIHDTPRYETIDGQRVQTRKAGDRYSDEELRAFFNEASKTLQSGGANKRADLRGQSGTSNVGGRRNAERQLHLRNADDEIAMAKRFGASNNIYDLLTRHLSGLSRDIETARMFGRGADQFVPRLIDKALEEDHATVTSQHASQGVKKLAYRAQREYTYIRHGVDTPGINRWGMISKNIRAVVSSSMLGGPVGSAFGDVGTLGAYAHAQGFTVGEVMRHVWEGMKPTAANMRRVNDLGLVVQGLANEGSRYGEENLTNHAVKWVSHLTHVINSYRMWDRGITEGMGSAWLNKLGHMSQEKPFEELDPADQADLQARGITPENWSVFRKAQLDPGPGGQDTLLTPDSIYGIKDADLADIAAKRLAPTHASLGAAMQALKERNGVEQEWVANRVQKLADFKANGEQMLEQLGAKHAVREGHAQGVADARAELIRAQTERAGVETDIAQYLHTEAHQFQIRNIMDSIEEGAESEKAAPGVNKRIQKYGGRINATGESFGVRRAQADARIAKAQANVDALAKAQGAKQDAAGEALDKRIRDRTRELTDFVKRSRDRALKRSQMIEAFKAQHGRSMATAVRSLRDEAATASLRLAVKEAGIAGRGAAGSNAREETALAMDKNPEGTWLGEAARWAFLLKRTPFGIFKTHMLDVPRSLGDDWKTQWGYRAKFAVSTGITGGLGMELSRMALGQDPEKLNSVKGAMALAMASGGLGMMGDFLLNDSPEHGDTSLAKIIGPGATAIEDAVNIGRTGVTSLLNGDAATLDKATFKRKLLGFARNYGVPAGRTWYLKAAFNHEVYQKLLDWADPGYAQRLNQRMQQSGTPSWWAPGTSLPQRAPNVKAALSTQPQ